MVENRVRISSMRLNLSASSETEKTGSSCSLLEDPVNQGTGPAFQPIVGEKAAGGEDECNEREALPEWTFFFQCGGSSVYSECEGDSKNPISIQP